MPAAEAAENIKCQKEAYPLKLCSPILHNKEIWLVQIRGGWTSQLSVAYLSEPLHPSLGISFPRMIQVPWLEYCGTLPEHLSVHCALSVPPPENDLKSWFCPTKLAKLPPTPVAPGLGLAKYFLFIHRLSYPVILNMGGYSYTHLSEMKCLFAQLCWHLTWKRLLFWNNNLSQ